MLEQDDSPNVLKSCSCSCCVVKMINWLAYEVFVMGFPRSCCKHSFLFDLIHLQHGPFFILVLHSPNILPLQFRSSGIVVTISSPSNVSTLRSAGCPFMILIISRCSASLATRDFSLEMSVQKLDSIIRHSSRASSEFGGESRILTERSDKSDKLASSIPLRYSSIMMGANVVNTLSRLTLMDLEQLVEGFVRSAITSSHSY